MEKKITTPLTKEKIKELKAGDSVLITGTIYTARDAAHKRLIELLDKGEKLPIDIEDSIVYYAGPTPEKPGQVIGSVGPTTSYRMDSYSPRLIEKGLRGMIGKGLRNAEVIESIKNNTGVYFAAIGGAAALIGKSVVKSEIVAYEDLGAEAIRKLEVVDFPAIVVIDCEGNNLYEIGPNQYLYSLK
ncbi:Fe-S-containing hydro-lyase [Clostridium prolinivorans]|uniref:Fe-S-containing hydro-lyase n=1 Tax=Clostridium prolinivorans TaxID=2769420 RepID=UPI000FD6BDEE|nr:Fe-S-containing hydro-lyase [Clostridium prolinivorans]